MSLAIPEDESKIHDGLVSQSEADTFLACERKHFYAFGLKLQSKSRTVAGGAMYRGTLGHSALETYYGTLIGSGYSNYDIAHAKEAALKVLQDEIEKIGVTASVDIVMPLYTWLEEYFDEYELEFDRWEILAVEKEFLHENFPFKPDMIKRDRLTGKVVVVDHKFIYNFYQPGDVTMFPQLAKYLGKLREMGYRIDEVEYNMIRTHANAQERFKRLPMHIPEARSKRYLQEQKTIEERINARKYHLSIAEWDSISLRSASSFSCPKCPFKDLCQTDLDGLQGREILIRNFFEANTYTYDKKEAIENV